MVTDLRRTKSRMMFSSGKRLEELARLIDSIDHLGPAQRLSEIPQDDIGKVAEAVNSLVERLRRRISELESESGRMQGILDSMIEGVIAVDADMCILAANPAAEKIFGADLSKAKGRLFLEVIQNTDIIELITEAQRNKSNVSRELNLLFPSQRILQVNASLISQADKVGGCLLVIHDITEMRKLELVRRDFVANVSHELKTPLTSIKGFIETLLEGALDDKENSRHFLEIIKSHAERLNSLINDLLDLASIESKQVGLKIEVFALDKLVEEVTRGFKLHLRKKGIEVHNKVLSQVTVTADRDKIEQVLTNLIDNAIKFNREKGNVEISSEELGQDIKITVEDSGAGIPPADIPRIFERFYRVDKARSREMGGTGLGLSIVKHIAELHGGSVGVESIEGLGSKFWFTIPGGRK